MYGCVGWCVIVYVVVLVLGFEDGVEVYCEVVGDV